MSAHDQTGPTTREKVCQLFDFDRQYVRNSLGESVPDFTALCAIDGEHRHGDKVCRDVSKFYAWRMAVSPGEPDRGDQPCVPWYPVSMVGMGQSPIAGGAQVPVYLWRRCVFDWAAAAREWGVTSSTGLIL